MHRIGLRREDDLDGGPADETIRFTFDDVDYEIDLSRANAEKLRAAIAAFIRHARRIEHRTPSHVATAHEMRKWAEINGFEVSDRGRISDAIQRAYQAATAEPLGSD